MRNYLEIAERAAKGPALSKEEWDFRIIDKVQALTEKYELSWDRDSIVPDDDKLIDRVFLAGKELISDIGVYSITDKRIIELTEEEIADGMQRAARPVTMGEGRDAFVS